MCFQAGLWIIQTHWDSFQKETLLFSLWNFSVLWAAQKSINFFLIGRSRNLRDWYLCYSSETGFLTATDCVRYQTHLLQCPHHGAKNSTIHTSSPSNTNLSKLSSVSSTTSFLLPLPPPLCRKGIWMSPDHARWSVLFFKRLQQHYWMYLLARAARAARFAAQPVFHQIAQSVHGSVDNGLATASTWRLKTRRDQNTRI